jgi:hypothetical protein
MKLANKGEEYLAWPPVAVLALLVVAPTLKGTVQDLHSYVPVVYGASAQAVYLFAIGMGAGLAWPLHGRYWLGFGWLAFLCYILVQVMRFLPESSGQQYGFVLSASLVMMFAALSLILYGKRMTFHRPDKS